MGLGQLPGFGAGTPGQGAYQGGSIPPPNSPQSGGMGFELPAIAAPKPAAPPKNQLQKDCRQKYPQWRPGQSQYQLYTDCLAAGLAQASGVDVSPCDQCGASNVAACLYCVREYAVQGGVILAWNALFVAIILIGVWALAGDSVLKAAGKAIKA